MHLHDLHRLVARRAAVLLIASLACGGSVTAPGGGSGGSGSGGPPVPISFVDPVKGSDANDGQSAKTAFRTLQRAAKELKPGWTIELLDGTYTTDGKTEPLVIDVSGTADAPIIISAAQGHTPVIQ